MADRGSDRDEYGITDPPNTPPLSQSLDGRWIMSTESATQTENDTG